MQRLSIKSGNQPVDGYRFAGLLESGDLRAANPGATALQRHEPKVQDIGVLFTDAENNRVDYAGTGRTALALKEGHAPPFILAVQPQRLFACRFCGMGLLPRGHWLARPRIGAFVADDYGTDCWHGQPQLLRDLWGLQSLTSQLQDSCFLICGHRSHCPLWYHQGRRVAETIRPITQSAGLSETANHQSASAVCMIALSTP